MPLSNWKVILAGPGTVEVDFVAISIFRMFLKLEQKFTTLYDTRCCPKMTLEV